ncbi:MAG: pilin [bacterium]|nr:pilin [bacterium]
MRKVTITIGMLFFMSVMIFMPVESHAFRIVPCDGVDTTYEGGGTFGEECGLDDFIILIKNVINSIIVLSIPIVTIALTWVGILLLTAQGNVGKITQAKQIAKSVIIGFVFILTAWLIVYTLVSVLLDDAFNLFLK